MELFVPGPAGRLQAKLWEPDGAPRAACVVCHPHPQRGGTLDTTVVFRIARALQEAGVAALRFNFRGVGASEGAYHGGVGPGGEEDDVIAALDELERRYPGLPLWAGGFSFGARTVASLASRDARVRRVVLVALPVLVFDCEAIRVLRTPGLVVQAGRDEFGTLADLEAAFPELDADLARAEIAGADHFFARRTQELQALVHDHATQWLDDPTP
ncbi:MAG: alpha/beta hydrolase [Planctomycetes bacterium]|nr:alpha/beta hydrolase [Planctomycetota bacterium]